MSFWQALLLGIVQGLTEFLPVSSSGHLIIFQEIFGLSGTGETDLLFDVLVHVGTLIAVVVAFRKTLWRLIREFFKMIRDIFTRKFSWKEAGAPRRMIVWLILSLLPLFAVLLFKDKIDPLLTSTLVVGVCLIFNAVILLLADMAPKGHKTAKEMTWKDALFVGIIQCVGILPGISRSGSTITAGVTSGMKRSFAAKYSFILSIPTILGAAILQIADAVSIGIDASRIPVYLVGMAAAAVSGYFAIRLLQYLLKSKRFVIFSVYCLVVGIAVLIWTVVS